MKPYRIGIINYTNTAPLLYKLESELAGLNVEFVRGVPTEINSALLAGEVDLANISAYEFLAHSKNLAALPDFSISVFGAVYSVNLFHTVAWQELNGETIGITTASATSVKLLQTLLLDAGIQAKLERIDANVAAQGLQTLLQHYKGVLLIGDEALSEWYKLCGPISDNTQMIRLLASGKFLNTTVHVTDLAVAWYKSTGLPFVFAVWASRKIPPLEIVLAMRRARRHGIGHLAEVTETEAARIGLPNRIVQHYLWNFRYHLEAPDKKGLETFAERVTPEFSHSLRYWDI